MLSRCRWAILTIWVLLLSVAAALHANDAALRDSGGIVRPMKDHPSIRMETCRIVGEIGVKDTLVKCDFVFVNDGPATTVTMGFPALGGYATRDPHALPWLRNFRSWVDGRRVATGAVVRPAKRRYYDGVLIAVTSPEAWYTKAVHFRRGQRRAVQDSYVQPRDDGNQGSTMFAYELSAGASWHGPIGLVDLTVRWTGPYEGEWRWSEHPEWGLPGLEVAPDGREVHWTAKDLEPKHEIWVHLYRGWSHLACDGFGTVLSERSLVRVYGDDVWMTPVRIAWILQGHVEYDNTTKTARVIRGNSVSVEATAGRAEARVNGEPVVLPSAPRIEAGRLWLPAGPVLAQLGHRIEIDRKQRQVDVYSGGPVARTVDCYWSLLPEDARDRVEQMRLVQVDGVLFGEVRPMMKHCRGLHYWRRSLRDKPPEQLPPGIDRLPALRPGPLGDSDLCLVHHSRKLELWWGSTHAQLGGEPVELPMAPYISLAGTGMVPLDSVLGPLGLQYAYDDAEGAFTMAAGETS